MVNHLVRWDYVANVAAKSGVDTVNQLTLCKFPFESIPAPLDHASDERVGPESNSFSATSDRRDLVQIQILGR